MALTKEPVFAQTPKQASAVASAANTALDGTGTVVTLLTAGADGALVTNIDAWATVTGTAKRINLFVSIDGGTSWKLKRSLLMAAYTVANTTVQTENKLVDRLLPNDAIRLPASAKLGFTTMVAEAIVLDAEYLDF